MQVMKLMQIASVVLLASCFAAPDETGRELAEAVIDGTNHTSADPVADREAKHRTTLALLRELGLGALDVTVEYQGGVATLYGSVTTAHDRQLAHNVALRDYAVRSVENGLAVVVPASHGPVDSHLERRDEILDARLLRAHAELVLLEHMGERALAIEAIPTAGSLVLTGSTRTQDDIDTAVRLMEGLDDLAVVESDLVVNPGS